MTVNIDPLLFPAHSKLGIEDIIPGPLALEELLAIRISAVNFIF
jgi:hypothetical protein